MCIGRKFYLAPPRRTGAPYYIRFGPPSNCGRQHSGSLLCISPYRVSELNRLSPRDREPEGRDLLSPPVHHQPDLWSHWNRSSSSGIKIRSGIFLYLLI